MAKVEKLPSGSYRIRVYDKTTGSRKSFTASSKAEVKLLAAEWENGIKEKTKPKDFTLDEVVLYLYLSGTLPLPPPPQSPYFQRFLVVKVKCH